MAIEKQNVLYLTEIFPSVQGETGFTGLPTTFIRLSQCNLRCTWCDTTYSFKKGTAFSFEQILDKVNTFGCRYICITGGEPLLQSNIFPLMSQLCDLGYTLSLETGGSLSIEQVDPRVHVVLDIKCPGSGMNHKNDWSNLDRIRLNDEVKFVIKDLEDYQYAKEIADKYDLYKKANVLFSPVFGELDPKDLVSWILHDKISVRLNMQIHKFIWSSETKGV